jgi:hypothetical protein
MKKRLILRKGQAKYKRRMGRWAGGEERMEGPETGGEAKDYYRIKT